MDTKQRHEWDVFQQFLPSSALDMARIECRDPPEPDIWCQGSEGLQYFELARLLDKEMQRWRNTAIKTAPNPVPMSTKVKLPEREVLKTKIAKARELYSTCGLPIDLLLYYDNETFMSGDVPAAPNLDTHYSIVMKPILEQQTQFRRVYVFERHQGQLLYRYPET
jgi:hypothetical protein